MSKIAQKAYGLLPQQNRAYTFGFITLVLGGGMCVVMLFKAPGAWVQIFEWFKNFALMLAGIVVGGKQAVKAMAAIRGNLTPKGGG